MKKTIFITVLVLFTSLFLPADDWKALFDQRFNSQMHSLWEGYSTCNDSYYYYHLGYGIDALTAMYEATDLTSYLDEALIYVNNVIDDAVSAPQYHDGYLGWLSLTETVNQEVPLYESCMWRYVTRLLQVMKDSGLSTNPTYSAQYNEILAFTEANMWDKWYHRGTNQQYIYRSRTHMASHWAYIALNLYTLTTDTGKKPEYQAVYQNINNDMRDVLQNVSPNAYFWNSTWYGVTPAYVQDVSHGNHMLSYILECYRRGIFWTSQDVVKFANTLKEICWNPTTHEFADYVDGTYGPVGGWDNTGRFQADGWVKLGRYIYDIFKIHEDFLDNNPNPNHASQLGQFYANMLLDSVHPQLYKSITVISPNGGENWLIGSNKTITWDCIGLTSTIKISLWKDGVLVGDITSNTLDPSLKSYSWIAGKLLNGTMVAAGSGYTIKIKENGTAITDVSNASFTLTSNTPPQIWLSKSSITQTVYRFDPTFTDNFQIKNSGGGTLQYTIDVTGGASAAVSPSPDSGSSTGETDTINLYTSPDKVAPGTKMTGQVVVSDSGASNSPQYIALTIYGKPLKASNPNPASGATNINLNPPLTWTAGEGAVKYDVYFGTSSLTKMTTTTGTSWTNTNLMYYSTVYQWRIDSVDANSKITTGDVWTFTTKGVPLAIAINLGNPDQNDQVYRVDVPDGNTEPYTIGGIDARRTLASDDYYMYFSVADSWAFQGTRPQLAITIIYYDGGTGYLELQYDSTANPYKSGGIVNLTNTNTWKQFTFNVSDAYFGNRENGGADFRIARNLMTTPLYLDWVHIAR